MDKVFLFVFNVFINSFLAFFTVVFLIEGIIFLCRLRQGRFASILRMIPILKLPFDLFWYDFSKWSYSHGINPLTCEEGARTLSVMISWQASIPHHLVLPITSGIQFTVPGNITFTIADLFSQFIPSVLLNGLCLFLLLGSLISLLNQCLCYRRFSTLLNRERRNYFEKDPLPIITSPSLVGSPFVAGFISPTIYIPQNLSQTLSRQEYEAILAHEMEHIRYKDNFTRLLLGIIRSLFWWIPTQWLQKRIEAGQEIGCDRNCKNYGVHPLDLASAICKAAKDSAQAPKQMLAHHLAQHTIQTRLNLLLDGTPARWRGVQWLCCGVAAIAAFFIVFLGRFWTF